MAITFIHTHNLSQTPVVVLDALHGCLVALNGAGTEVPPGPLTREWIGRHLLPHVQTQDLLVRKTVAAAAQGLGVLELMLPS